MEWYSHVTCFVRKKRKIYMIILQQEIWKLSRFNNVKEKLDTVTQRPGVYIDLRKKITLSFPAPANADILILLG